MKKKRSAAPEGTAPSSLRDKSLKNGLIKAALIVSPFFFFALIGIFWLILNPETPYMACCVILGLLSSLLFSRVRAVRFGTAAMITGAVLSAAVCFIVYSHFLTRSANSVQAMAFISGLISETSPVKPESAIRYFVLLLTLLSSPFLFFTSSFIINYIFSLCGRDSLHNFRVTLRKVSFRNAAVTHLFFIVNISAAVIAGVLLLCAAYAVPVGSIDKNVSRSAALMEEEGDYPYVVSWCFSNLDNPTDAITLLMAADDSDAPLLTRAMLNKRAHVPGKRAYDTLVSHYCHGGSFEDKLPYGRYWHGSLVFIKPLLYFTDLRAIRLINGACQLLLAILLCIALIKKDMRGLIIPFIISYLMIKPVQVSKNFEFSSCYYIIVIGCLALLCIKGVADGRRASMLFLNIGIAVGYFDFLTYPAATYGVPAVMYLYLLSDRSLSEKIVRLLKAGYSWLFGYAVMWFSKWIVGSFFTDTNIINDGISQTLYRLSSKSGDTGLAGSLSGWLRNVISCLARNALCFLDNPFVILFIIFIAIIIFRVKNSKELGNKTSLSQGINRILAPYIFLAAVPFIWYSVALNHSSIHYWFTNKALIMTVMAAMTGTLDMLRYCRMESGRIQNR